jgi:hypothetical protein
MTSQDALILIDAIKKADYKLNDWENEFLQNIAMRRSQLSAKQDKALTSIYEKANGGGIFQKREYIRKKLI